MPHPLVLQLRFTRTEFQRALRDLSAEDAIRRIEPMNCLSWIVGHLAAQEQRYWLTEPQGLTPAPEVKPCASGEPASTPPLDEMWAAWHLITEMSDAWLDTLDSEKLLTFTLKPTPAREPAKESIGTRLYRTIYHYWYHMGDALAVRQMLGHTQLPGFVGDQGGKAPYVREENS